jgi:hypothetical protein
MIKLLRTSCALLLAMWWATDSNAQSLQIKGGLNYATVTGDTDYKFAPRFYIGVAKDIRLSNYVSFQPELFYSLQGTRTGDSPGLGLDYYYHYIQMPLYFNFSIGKKAGLLWGPQIGLLSRANLKTSRGDKFVTTPFMNPFEIQVGGGPYVKVNERLKIELRIAIGITRIDRDDDRLRNFVLQTGVAWQINKPVKE